VLTVTFGIKVYQTSIMKTSIIILVLLAWGVISTPRLYGCRIGRHHENVQSDEVQWLKPNQQPAEKLPTKVEVITQEQIGFALRQSGRGVKKDANLDVGSTRCKRYGGNRGFSPRHIRGVTR
jgi:hypothetical protein